MSGISGIVSRSRNPSIRAHIDMMTRSLDHRGPDGSGVWVNEARNVALGHVLLATTPESKAERQPLSDMPGGVALTADLRIDNRESIHRSLRLESSPSDPLTSPKLLARAYRKWGAECTDHLFGDYAYAIWDGQSGHLLCVRDPMGVKPLYYVRTDSIFAFASEIRSLLTLPGVSDQINRRQVLTFLSGGYTPREETFFESIKCLEPGHLMHVFPDLSTSSERYWSPARQIEKLSLRKDSEYERKFRKVLEQAVGANLRSIGEVGILLSGGMDSSSVASVADAHERSSSAPLHTFSYTFPSLTERKRRFVDEREYIDAVLESGEFDPHFLDAGTLSPLHQLEDMVEVWGQPFNIRGLYTVSKILENARGNGVRVLLDGAEGDSVIGYGYDLLTQLGREDDWERFAEIARQHSENYQEGRRKYPPEKVFWNHGFGVIVEHLRRGRLRRFYRSANAVSKHLGIPRYLILKRSAYWVWPSHWRKKLRFMRNEERDLVPSEKFKRLGVSREDRSALGDLPSDEPLHVQRSLALQENRALTNALEAMDPIFAAHHVEARHPLYDRRVIELCLSLPADQRFKGGWTRSILRRSLRNVLPDKIRRRLGKVTLEGVIAHNLRRFEKDRLSDFILDDALRPFVDREVATEMLDRFRESGEPDSACTRSLLRMAVVSVWLRKRRHGNLKGPPQTVSLPKE
ncbi:lasso peptide isopeptide bond-forming cyclase [Salinibacter ruber]|uniref:asparagine synthase (glutamine-hydrolyzing) n=1 Tax=Salinibacter ruber (strain M8) TaxID=761659 RepID=D5H531_SALRM|nr:lasso peptide isopeptide bond-forming cyclase [Salinibacter ruber]CBH23136.1 Asparagine synthetase B [glutamine-hydrolyzing] [Salinibacter ruber M8]